MMGLRLAAFLGLAVASDPRPKRIEPPPLHRRTRSKAESLALLAAAEAKRQRKADKRLKDAAGR